MIQLHQNMKNHQTILVVFHIFDPKQSRGALRRGIENLLRRFCEVPKQNRQKVY